MKRMRKPPLAVLFLILAANFVFAVPDDFAPSGSTISALVIWDNGLSEMSYFAATERIYGVDCAYTRVQLVNRQWMDALTGIKADRDYPRAVPVFKMNISEQIPTENYNYRYLISIFLKRRDLTPFKLAASSQEWCGNTYKHLRWNDDALTYQSFSYFSEQGDHTWNVDRNAIPYEALLLIARDVAARREPLELIVLPPVRSNHAAKPVLMPARLVPTDLETLDVPAGRFRTLRVVLNWQGPPTRFNVAVEPPYQLVRYQTGDAHGELTVLERRPYWDRSSFSSFYEKYQAP